MSQDRSIEEVFDDLFNLLLGAMLKKLAVDHPVIKLAGGSEYGMGIAVDEYELVKKILYVTAISLLVTFVIQFVHDADYSATIANPKQTAVPGP